MKIRIVSAAALLSVAISVKATVLMVEDFNYTADAVLLGQGSPVWTISTKADNAYDATPDFSVSTSGLTMDSYGDGAAALGYGAIIPQATLTNPSKQRVIYKNFDGNATRNSGNLYAAFLMNVSVASNNARDFMSFDGATGTTQRARLFTKKVGDGFQLAVSRANTSPVYTQTLTLNTIYLVVLKYAFIEGSANDEATVFVGFPLGSNESAAAAYAAVSTDKDAATNDPSALRAIDFKIRDGGSAMQISHIRVATTWDEAVNYTGEPLGPDDPGEDSQVKFHFQEGFDSNGQWTISGAGASTAKNHGEFGTTSRSISFNKTETADKCNNARMISPVVKTAGVLRFWLTGSANETRGNVMISKIIGNDTTDVVYLEGPFGKTWTEYMVIINDPAESIKIMLTVSGCGLAAGTLYIDDVSLTNYVAGARPIISDLALTEPFPSKTVPSRVIASIAAGENGRSINSAELLWGYDAATSEGVLPMTASGGIYRSELVPATEAGQIIFYRVVAFDNYYESDTSSIGQLTIYKDYEINTTPQTLPTGHVFPFAMGIEGLRVDFGTDGQAEELTIVVGDNPAQNYNGVGPCTTGDLAIVTEPGEMVSIMNNGTSPVLIRSVHYNPVRPVVFTARPQRLQLYPRSSNNTADVQISGYTQQSDISQLTFVKKRNNVIQETIPVSVSKGVPFNVTFSITAEPAEYRFEYAIGAGEMQLLADSVVAGDVYVIAGQSNGAAAASGNPGVFNEYWRNFGCVQKTAVYNPADTAWGLSNTAGWGYGRMFYNGYSGYILQRNLLQEQNMPTAVLNIAIGGSSLNQNMPNEDNHEDLSTFYGEGLYRLRKAGLADAVRAIIWVQGESDQNGLYEDYAVRFDRLYQAWKQDYPNVEHFYVSQINVGCGTSTYASEMREVQRRFAEQYDDMTVVTNIGITIRYDSCHYEDAAYDRLYTQFSRLIEQDLYGKTFTKPLTSPSVQSVRWRDESKSSIEIRFDQEMVWPGIMWGRDMKDYFYNENDQPIPMASGRVDANDHHMVVLELESSVTKPTHLTYGPDNYVYSSSRGMDTLYVDPWLRNSDGYAALTFNRFPIADYAPTAIGDINNDMNARSREVALLVEDGYVLIRREGSKFDLTGRKID